MMTQSSSNDSEHIVDNEICVCNILNILQWIFNDDNNFFYKIFSLDTKVDHLWLTVESPNEYLILRC